MNFYEHQDQARKRTKIIVLLFIVAVLMIMTIVVVPVGLVSEWNAGAIATGAVFCVLIVGISTLVKLRQLNGGGRVVAEMLGGTALETVGGDPAQRKVKNIVEEMAIASGMPVPPVYIIEDDSINAFAAGWSPSDAVIGVTRGCIEKLSRDELQGVIAHEFSHISHGDMRINIRLIGVIFGIMAIGITGWIFVQYIGPVLLRSASRSRSKEGAAGAGIGLGIILFGLFLVTCGAIGTFFGRLIQAAVSRQREFLADASAVQYTRNPTGIGNALRKIGSIPTSSFSKDVGQYNHMFFSQAVSSLFASHPPIEERVARVENVDVSSIPTSSHIKPGDSVANASGFSAGEIKEGIRGAGAMQETYIDRAKTAIGHLPPALRKSLDSGWSARLVMLALLVDRNHPGQKSLLEKNLTEQELGELKTLIPLVGGVDRASRLPMVDLAAPSLKQLSDKQQLSFAKLLRDVTKSDGVVSRFEWVLVSVIQKHLANNVLNKLSKRSNKKLDSLAESVVVVLATLAYSGAETQEQAVGAFENGLKDVRFNSVDMPTLKACSIQVLHGALQKLQSLRFTEKQTFLQGCESCVEHDGKVTVAEAETIRAIGDVLDCPIPMFA